MSVNNKGHDPAKKYLPQIERILKDNAKYIIRIVVAPQEKDIHKATDFIIQVDSGDVAVRLRNWSKWTIKREWTVRSKLDSGYETELSKLKKGYARWYLYGWVQDDVVFSWMLIDLDIVRKEKILDMSWKEKANRDDYGKPDGTYFIIIPNEYLKHHGCIVSYECIGSLLIIDTITANTKALCDYIEENKKTSRLNPCAVA